MEVSSFCLILNGHQGVILQIAIFRLLVNNNNNRNNIIRVVRLFFKSEPAMILKKIRQNYRVYLDVPCVNTGSDANTNKVKSIHKTIITLILFGRNHGLPR